MIKLLIAILLGVAAVGATDPFDNAKSRLAAAGCVEVDFLSILESDVFDVVDSIRGTAMIAKDGRYFVNVGAEQYLYDGQDLYTYSEETDQVVIEEPSGELFGGSEIAVVTRLDDYYRTESVIPGREYRLTRSDTTDTRLPDTLTVLLRPGAERIDGLVYLDINGDLNRVVFLDERISADCRDSAFIPAFPPSAERIRL